jgi:hypothetical protein
MFQIKVVETIKVYIFSSITFFRKSYRLCENVKNMVEPERTQMTIQRRVASWIIKATRSRAHARVATRARKHTHTHTHTEKYLIVIAFPRQKQLRERASVLGYTYIACLV